MKEVIDPQELRALASTARRQGRSVELVPTMGALHAGHLALVEAARKPAALIVMSLFVNPTQFGPGEDFDRYPRSLDADRRLAADAGVNLLFTPEVATMYPAPQQVWVEPQGLGEVLEGRRRPGHFTGVCTVVAKLFNLVQPDSAYFGQKDGQQLIVIRAMVRDLAFPVSIVEVPTVRESDGLALSSRNVYLTSEQRAQAAAISRGLQCGTEAVRHGERTPQKIEDLVRRVIERDAPLGEIDYVSLVRSDTLEAIEHDLHSDAMLAAAVSFGRTRLIDNLQIRIDGDHLTIH